MPEVDLQAHRVRLDVYGIKQCDTCRRALQWLDLRRVPWQFHDFRVAGVQPALLREWLDSDFSSYLVNKRSTTWRNLNGDEKKQALVDPFELLLQHPTLIKRPVFMLDGDLLAVGFSPGDLEDYI